MNDTRIKHFPFITIQDEKNIKKILRKYSSRSKLYYEVRKNVRHRKDKKYFYQCAKCKELFEKIEHDHKEPVGHSTNLYEFINALFCDPRKMQILCKPCHETKTAKDTKKIKTLKKKKEK